MTAAIVLYRRPADRVQARHRASLLSITITSHLYRMHNDREEARRAVEDRWGKWGRRR
jgi:hypothetical protein